MPRRKVTGPQMLVDAAVRLFERKGYQNTTIDDIADAVGIAKPTVYQYVKSKSWLLEQIFESVLSRLKEDLDTVADMEDPADQFRELIRYYVNAIHDLRPYFLIFFGEERELPARTRRHFREYARAINEEVAGIFRRGQASGALRRDVDPKLAAFLVIGMLTSIARWYDPKGRLRPEELSVEIQRILESFAVPQRGRARAAAR